MNKNLIVQLIGVCGIVCNMLIYQQKTRERVLEIKLISDVIWAIHYFALDALSAACVACIGILRETAFLKTDKRGRAAKIWFCIFILISLASAALTWQSVYSVLPACASVLSIISFAQGKPKWNRRLSFPISACMGCYGFINGSVAGVINEILTVISSIAGCVRLDKKE